tara:strand:- start:52 stop:201 length:150 start_codon:yes stop_codon:yes gene_type:complete
MPEKKYSEKMVKLNIPDKICMIKEEITEKFRLKKNRETKYRVLEYKYKL